MNKILFLCLILLYSNISCSFNKQEASVKALKKGFENPPLEARPRALWAWVDGNFDLEEITHEMEEAKKMGLGGFDIWDVWSVVDEEHKITPGPSFMSDEYLVAICHAINEAKRLDLDLGLIISSGWNAGGPWTLPQNQTMGIYHSDTIVAGPENVSFQMQFPVLPGLSNNPADKNKIFIPLGEDGLPEFYKTVAVLAINAEHPGKLSPGSDIIDLSGKVTGKGFLETGLPPGKWNIQWFVCTNTGQPMIASTPNSRGPMIDHFNPEASIFHINFFIDKLEKALGRPLENSGLSYFYTDSYEVQGSLWTPNLTEEFQKRKGYSLVPFLPALEGVIVSDSNVTARFKFDFRQVLSDLIIESHYAKTREICEQHGVGFVAEAAGPGMPVHNCPFESLKSSGSLSWPRGEFWHLPSNSKYWMDLRDSEKSDHYLNQLQVIKGVASASHIYNQKFVEAESFTGTHLWNEGPGDLKPTLDRAFCEGLNRVLFHTWPHTAKASGTPGWVYSLGTIFNENRVWWPMVKPFIDYIGRSSYLLQQGNFAADILFYYGDEAPNFAPPKSIIPELGPGYDYDYINTEILLNKLNFSDGEFTLNHDQRYKVLVLPDSRSIRPEVLEKISSFLHMGAIVVGPEPEMSYGLLNHEKNDALVRSMAEKTWGELDGKTVFRRQIGKGTLYWGLPLRDVMMQNNILPDFDFRGDASAETLDFIHRDIDGIQVYFIRNTGTEALTGAARFRAGGEKVEYWNPESGSVSPVNMFNYSGGVTEIPMLLDALQSVFIVISGVVTGETIQTWDPTNYKTENPTIINHQFSQKWTIDFPSKWKGPGKIEVDSLFWWNDFSEDNVRFFSGIAIYENFFDLDKHSVSGEKKYQVSFSDLAEVAEVFVNGKYTGTIWHSPFELDITSSIKPGKNSIQINVANTWANRLCGDARLPVSERITNTNPVRLPNAWSHPMKDIPLQDYPLINSGIPGEINLTELSYK